MDPNQKINRPLTPEELEEIEEYYSEVTGEIEETPEPATVNSLLTQVWVANYVRGAYNEVTDSTNHIPDQIEG